MPVLQPITQSHSAAGAAGGNEESWRNGCCAAVTDSLLEVLLWSPELLSVPPPQQGPLHWRLQKCLLAARKGTATAALQPCDSKTLSRKANANGIQRGRMHRTPRRRRNYRWTAIYISARVRKESRAAAGEVASSQRLFCLKRRFALSSASQALRPQVSVLFFPSFFFDPPEAEGSRPPSLTQRSVFTPGSNSFSTGHVTFDSLQEVLQEDPMKSQSLSFSLLIDWKFPCYRFTLVYTTPASACHSAFSLFSHTDFTPRAFSDVSTRSKLASCWQNTKHPKQRRSRRETARLSFLG